MKKSDVWKEALEKTLPLTEKFTGNDYQWFLRKLQDDYNQRVAKSKI